MNRKNTILLAVLVNAGLLIALFMTALTSQEEIAIAPTHEVAGLPSQESTPPLFGDEIDLALRQPSPATQPLLPLPQVLPESSPMSPESSIVHALPPAVSEPAPEVFPATPAHAEPSRTEVAVKKGDTLEKIAKAHHTTVDEIIKVNQLPSSFLRAGQKLKIPAGKPAEKIAAAKPAKKPVETRPDYYTVKVGDNAWSIAMKHHIKVDELLKFNNLNEEKARKLKPGDRLRTR